MEDNLEIFEDLCRSDSLAKHWIEDKLYYFKYNLPLVELKNKKILVLGCGSKENNQHVSHTAFEPWLARALTILGSKVTGIDRAESFDENYTHIKMNLFDESLVDKLNNEKFDIVTAMELFNDPSVLSDSFLVGERSRKNAGIDYEDFTRKVSEEVFRLLNINGMYLISPIWNKELPILENIGFDVERKMPYSSAVARKSKMAIDCK